MQSAIEQFRISASRVRDLVAIYSSVKAKTTPALDLSDILRAALVLAVSALDYYVHEVVRIGMLEIHRGQRPEPSAFCRFSIALGSAREGLDAARNIDSWLEDEIRQRHSYKSFQQPDNIADAIRLISDKKLWKEVSSNIGGTTEKNIKDKLCLIIDRRNKIAHEADINPTYPGSRWSIDEVLVNDAIDFIEQIVESIHKTL